jgi:AcrR family transcriptional regulator
MTADRQRRARDPKATRDAILEAAIGVLAKDGPEGLSLSQVAVIAGVNRGTAYQHFETREKLIAAATEWASSQLYLAVFGTDAVPGDVRVEDVNIVTMTERLAQFAMDNAELCRIWLLHIIAAPDPADDLFWREYHRLIARFAATPEATPGIDHEVWTVIVLAGAFLWPTWARHYPDAQIDGGPLAQRFSRELLRLSLYGSMRAEAFPKIAELLAEPPKKPR